MLNESNKLYELQELLTINGGPIPLSRAGIYSAAAKGDIPTVSIGRRKFVPAWYVDGLLMPPKKKGA
ncbi:MAG: hypothetical protein ABFD50_20445 [Smithella sp.]